MSTKRLSVIVSAALGLLLLAGCSSLRDKLNILTGSGNPVTREFDFSDFDEVAIENAFEGTITRGDAYRVVVTVDDNLLDVLEVGQNGNRVTLALRDATVVANANLSFEITMPALRVLEASGASRAQITGFDASEDLRAAASGASRIEGDINSGDANFNASGASTITLRGAGGDVQAEASGASTIDLSDFATADANVTASGSSNITVNTTGRLDAQATGASKVHYLGQPTLGTLDSSGSSSIDPR